MDRLMEFLNNIHPLSEALQEHLRQILKRQTVGKKKYLLKVGRVCDKVYFIQTGLMRCYYLKADKDISAWFMKEGDVVFSVESFYTQKPSHEAIQALEDTVVYYITYSELQAIYRVYPEFNLIGRVLTEYYYTLSEQRLQVLRLQKSLDRYAYLLDKHPELLRRVPAKFLATYLGVSEAYLSRIKAKR